jgi:tRNA modification GTPase
MTDDDRRDIDRLDPDTPRLVVWNKIDIARAQPTDGVIEVSSVTGTGIPDLNRAIELTLLGGELKTDIVIDSARQYGLLVRAADALDAALRSHREQRPADVIAIDLQDALAAMGEITGEIASAEILDAMFSGFCVGK